MLVPMATYIYVWEFKDCVLIPTQQPPVCYICNMRIIRMLNPTSSSIYVKDCFIHFNMQNIFIAACIWFSNTAA